MLNAKVTGRVLAFSPDTVALNPNLFSHQSKELPQARPKPPTKQARRIRQDTKPKLNKLETQWRDMLLVSYPRELVTEQAMRLQLGNGIWYKPDFVVFDQCGLLAYEVKGPHAFRGGFENLKVAASLYRAIRFKLVWREGSEWKEQEVLP